MAAAAKLRNSCSLPNLLLLCLNIFLLLLSSASLAPILIIKLPPTPLAYAFLLASFISILSSITGFFSQLTHLTFVTNISLLLTSSLSQLLTIVALFTHEQSCLKLLKSSRDTKEAKLLVRLECGIMMSMLMLNMLTLVLSCLVHSCWVREYEGLMAEKWKKRMDMARVEVEQMEEGEVCCKEFGGCQNMNSKWVKTDFEG